MIKKIGILVFVSILFSCKNDQLHNSYIYFKEAQPENVKTITSFPKKYLGSFNRDYAHQLRVTANCVLSIETASYQTTEKEIGSFVAFDFKNNVVYDKDTQKPLKTVIKNDTISWETESVDTVFSFAENEVAKMYKSSLILNKKVDDKYLVNVIKFNFSNNKYIQFGTKEDFNLINSQLHIPFEAAIENSDTIFVVLQPNRADFRKLLRLDGFKYERWYYFK